MEKAVWTRSRRVRLPVKRVLAEIPCRASQRAQAELTMGEDQDGDCRVLSQA